MTVITLTQKQIEQLAEMASRFPEVEVFKLEDESASGIGSAVRVKFTLFNRDANFDITDYESW